MMHSQYVCGGATGGDPEKCGYISTRRFNMSRHMVTYGHVLHKAPDKPVRGSGGFPFVEFYCLSTHRGHYQLRWLLSTRYAW